jgi:hypothetical protein
MGVLWNGLLPGTNVFIIYSHSVSVLCCLTAWGRYGLLISKCGVVNIWGRKTAFLNMLHQHCFYLQGCNYKGTLSEQKRCLKLNLAN